MVLYMLTYYNLFYLHNFPPVVTFIKKNNCINTIVIIFIWSSCKAGPYIHFYQVNGATIFTEAILDDIEGHH